MPIYEYRCENCESKTSVFVRTVSSPVDAACSSCGSKEMTRLITSFGISKTVSDVHEAFSNPNSSDYYSDPRNIGRWTEEKFANMGMEIPSSVRNMIDSARDGEMPGAAKDLQPNVNEI
ncbi:MAG: zinc ribbon domain-containing protein [Chloroflexi bacterium]|jgi:putative FmdB family regulatory protein|nr:zinc ribbon domain-containing protein [Chloroflexota bacterium]